MKKKSDKRLLSSLDYIDDKFTARAAKKIKTRQVGMTGGVSKKRMVKYVSLLAACMILLGAAIPIATGLINKLPHVIDPSASNGETTAPEAEKPEEYFSDAYFGGVNNVYQYDGQFIYMIEESSNYWSYNRIVKYDPVTDKVSSVCLDPSCTHTPGNCPLTSPEVSGWNLNYMEVFDDWLIYDFSYSGADKVIMGTMVCLYNMKTGEAKTLAETTTTDGIYQYPVAYLIMDGKVYLSFMEREREYIDVIVRREYIVSYDLESEEIVYMCEEPEGMGFVGISNKRFFYMKGRDETWSSDHNGENLKKEEILTFHPVAVSGTYAYDFSIKDDDDDPATMNVYNLVTDSKFKIDFGGRLKDLRILEDKLFYVIYKSEDKTGGTELWTCDKRGENRQLLLESEDLLFSPKNCIGNYIFGDTHINGIDEHYIFNTETGELKAVPRLVSAN